MAGAGASRDDSIGRTLFAAEGPRPLIGGRWGTNRTRLREPDAPLVIAVSACLLLVFLGGSSPISTVRPALDVVVAMGTLAASGSRLRRARVYALPVLFMVWCSISILWSVDQYATTRSLAYVMPTFVVLFLAASLLGPEGVERALYLTIRAALAITIVDIIVKPGAAFRPAIDGAPGLSGPFAHKNALGFFFAVGAIVTLDHIRRTRRGQLVLLGCAAAVLLSHSSTALVTALGGLLAYVAIDRLLLGYDVPRRATNLVALLLVVVVAPLLALQHLAELTSLIGRDLTLSGRLTIWRAMVPEIERQPFRGYGFGATWLRRTEFNDRMIAAIHFHPFHGHNAYLDALLQIGLVGFVLLVAMALSTLGRLAVRAMSGEPGALAGAVVMLMMLAAAMSESPALLDYGAALLALLFGASTGGQRPSLSLAPTGDEDAAPSSDGDEP